MTDDERWNQIHRERVRLQTQLDRLDERVARLERHDRQLAYQRQLPALLDHITERLVRLENGGRLPGVDDAPTPPSAPALDEAAKWHQVANISGVGIRPAKEVLAACIALHLAAPADERDEWRRLANERQETIKALSAQLADPADRVPKPDPEAMAETIYEWRDVLGSEGLARKIIETHWTPAGAEEG